MLLAVERPNPDPLRKALVAGRSALPAFLLVEGGLRAERDEARAEAQRAAAEAEAEAARIRREGEERLKQVVVDAEAQAAREAEARARDRVSAARVETQRWVEEAERAAESAVDDALDLCCGD